MPAIVWTARRNDGTIIEFQIVSGSSIDNNGRGVGGHIAGPIVASEASVSQESAVDSDVPAAHEAPTIEPFPRTLSHNL